MILWLPEEIIILICSLLDRRDLLVLAQVNRRLYSIANDDQLWRPLVLSHLPSFYHLSNLPIPPISPLPKHSWRISYQYIHGIIGSYGNLQRKWVESSVSSEQGQQRIEIELEESYAAVNMLTGMVGEHKFRSDHLTSTLLLREQRILSLEAEVEALKAENAKWKQVIKATSKKKIQSKV